MMLEKAMKHQIRTLLLASLISGAMVFALAGCSRRSAGEGAASNTSATNANSAAQSGSAAATPAEQPPMAPSEVPATTASRSEPGAGAEAPKSNALASAAPHEEKPLPPRTYTIQAGRPISIFTTNTLSTKTNKPGDSFVGTLAGAVVDKDWVIAKKGATVEGVVTNSDPGGKLKGVASLTVVLKRLELADGRKVELRTSAFTKQAKTTKKKDAIKIGGGAAAGALIGAIVGGKKGAAIGAGVGGGAGTGVVLATRGDPAAIPSETPLTFRLRAPVTVVKR
jgi:hypothetical protein